MQLLTAELECFINQHLHSKTADLVFKIRKQFNIAPDFIIHQINGRNKAPQKLPSWANVVEIVYPNPISLEQCSSELTAQFKATLLSGNHLIDLTGGFGIDTYFLAKSVKTVDYCEQNPDLFEVVSHNFSALNASNIHLNLGDALHFLADFKGKSDWIYIDPSRRNEAQSKVFLLEDCSPNITQFQALLFQKSKNTLLKLSPMLDLAEITRKLKGVQQIWVLSVKNECKEVLVHLSEATNSGIKIQAINLQEGEKEVFEATDTEKQEAEIQLGNPQAYIYEPNKSVLKAGLQDVLAAQNGLLKLDYRSNFFTSETLNLGYAGRVFGLKSVIKPKKQFINAHLENGKANIIARNFPLNAQQIYEQYKIIPGGDTYLLATQLSNKENVLIVCERLK